MTSGSVPPKKATSVGEEAEFHGVQTLLAFQVICLSTLVRKALTATLPVIFVSEAWLQSFRAPRIGS